MKKYICDSCSKKIAKRQRYCLRIELFAAPEVCLDEEDLLKDSVLEFKAVSEQAKSMSSQKLEEDVYVCYDLSLCKRCRDVFSNRIKCKEFI